MLGLFGHTSLRLKVNLSESALHSPHSSEWPSGIYGECLVRHFNESRHISKYFPTHSNTFWFLNQNVKPNTVLPSICQGERKWARCSKHNVQSEEIKVWRILASDQKKLAKRDFHLYLNKEPRSWPGYLFHVRDNFLQKRKAKCEAGRGSDFEAFVEKIPKRMRHPLASLTG